MDILTTFAQNVKIHRIKKGFSQETLAELSGLHRTYISFIERGQRNASLRNVEKIAVALDIDSHILLLSMKEGDK